MALLHQNFYAYVYDTRVRLVMVKEDNQEVLLVRNDILLASWPIMAHLRKMKVVIRVMGVNI